MKGITKTLRLAVFMGICLGVLGFPGWVSGQTGAPSGQPIPTPEPVNPYISKITIPMEDGKSIDQVIIKGPPSPPPGYEDERSVVTQLLPAQAAGSKILTVPAYEWVFGCSAVSAAMIAGYYDNTVYPEMYTGPTNGGVMPLDSSSWPDWTDSYGKSYANNPLVASHQGLDGRASFGSIDDYWVRYESNSRDPYLAGHWTQHSWGDAIGDYMKTSQSPYDNVDGATTFYTWGSDPSPLTCADMEGYRIDSEDGTYGRKLFYEARGYTVTDCYSQMTDNQIAGGFSFAQYKAEIDAGRPVMLNLEGHTIVGTGYDDTGNTVYIHDTWDYAVHSMTWGGGYSSMDLLSVSIVNLATPLPANFTKISPPNASTGVSTHPLLDWETSIGATGYEYCIDTTGNDACNDAWVSVGNSSSANITGLSSETPYFWQVRAINSAGATYATGGDWWSFTTGSPTAVTVAGFTSSIAHPYGIQLQWSSASEVNMIGFNLYRAEMPDGAFVQVNPNPIPALTPGAMSGNDYTYTDSSVKAGVRYSYKLMQLDTNSIAHDGGAVDGGYYLLHLPLLSDD